MVSHRFLKTNGGRLGGKGGDLPSVLQRGGGQVGRGGRGGGGSSLNRNGDGLGGRALGDPYDEIVCLILAYEA